MKGEDAGTEAWINTIADKIDERKRKKKKEAEQNKKDKKEFKKKLALGKDLGLGAQHSIITLPLATLDLIWNSALWLNLWCLSDANQDGQITKAELKAYLMKQNGGEVSDQVNHPCFHTCCILLKMVPLKHPSDVSVPLSHVPGFPWSPLSTCLDTAILCTSLLVHSV